MDELSVDDDARQDVRVLFLGAAQMAAADQIARAQIQTDDRIPVPLWLFNRYSKEPTDA